MRLSLFAPLALGAALAVSCQTGSPTTPFTSTAGPAPEVTGAIVSDGTYSQAAMGAYDITIDPATLEMQVEPLAIRSAAVQGDEFLLSVRPFLNKGDVTLTGVTRGGSGGIDLTVQLKHPFALPADLTPPATATKRIDLHAFDMMGIVVADGSDSYFGGAVKLDAGLMQSADGYRDPGILFDKTTLGVPASGANVFPYVIFARQIDTETPVDFQGNFDETNDGWQGPALLDPQGFDVFPMGASVERSYSFAAPDPGDPLRFRLVFTCKYMDPRTGATASERKAHRLPTTDPNDLRYILPEACGDLQRIRAIVSGNLADDSSADIVDVTATVLDWDHGQTVATTWPNDANLNEIREASDIVAVDADFPDLRASSPFSGGSVTPAPSDPVLFESQIAINNTDLFDAASGGEAVLGLIRVQDAQDANDPSPTGYKPYVFDESAPAPVTGAIISSTRYQVVPVIVDDANSNPGPGPTAFSFPPTVEVNQIFSLDLDTAVPALATLDPDGLSLFEVDWEDNGSWDESIAATVAGADFTHTYTVVNATQPYNIRITDAHASPASTVYGPFSVDVQAVSPVTPTLGPEVAVNGTQTAFLSVQFDRYSRPVASLGTNVYAVWGYTSGTARYTMARSADGGATWGAFTDAPATFAPAAAADGANSRAASVGVLADGTPVMVCVGTNSPLGPSNTGRLQVLRYTNSGTNLVSVAATDGAVINGGWFFTPIIVPHRTDPTKAWIVASDNVGSVVGSNQTLSVFASTNANIANPTYSQVAIMDDAADLLSMRGADAVLSSTGILHVVWTSESQTGVYYRAFDTNTNTVLGGTSTRVSDVTQTSFSAHAAIQLDGTTPVVLYDLNDFAATTTGEIFATRHNGTSFPVATAITSAPEVTSTMDFVIDGTGRLITTWRDRRALHALGARDIYGKVVNANFTDAAPEYQIGPSVATNNALHAHVVQTTVGPRTFCYVYLNNDIAAGKLRARTFTY